MGTKKAPEAEIEITPDMIAAGVEEYELSWGADGNLDVTASEMVADIFRSMWAAKVAIAAVPAPASAEAACSEADAEGSI